ncbi:MAG: tetratricopeptide repeat protein, partial [Planctomycetaceae bacterium]
MKPRIFISAVTSEFGTSRQLVANVLSRLGYDPVWQDIFGTESGDLRQVLREKIDDCDGLLQLVGRGYGAEPPTADAEFGRVSYTQFEFLYARARGKKTWLIFADDACTRDRPLDELDLPRDEGEPMSGTALAAGNPDFVSGTALAAGHSPENVDPDSPVASAKPLKASAIQSERRALQEAWRQRWQKESHLFHGVASDTDLELRVERLRDEFAELRREFRWWQQSVTRNLTIVAALVLVSVGIGMYVARQQQQLPERVTEKTAEQVQQAQEKTADQIAAAQQKTAEHVERSLEKVVQVLANPAVLADRIRKEIHTTAEAKIKTLPDEKGRGRLVAEIEKERDLALGRVDDLIKLIQEGLKEGASPVFQRAAEILQKEGTDAAIEYLESRRPSTLETARRHAEQAKTAQARADAEKELRNKSLQALVLEANLLETKLKWQPALELREQVIELAPDWFEARTRLGLLYLNLGRFRAAEPHLQVGMKLAANPADETVALNNFGQLLKATNRLAEAEPLMRCALAIDEQSYGAEDPHVAIQLSNLAQLLQATNRLAEAEPLIRRALTVVEQSLGVEHPYVANSLNNLAQLLQDTNRLAKAEPLMRRALAIDEQSYGAEHPDVARDLNNLALLLKATNRLAEAEPLMRQHMVIFHKFGLKTGHPHPHMQGALVNYRDLLQAMKLPEDEISQRVKEATAITGRLKPILPEVERLLGPAQPVAKVLAALDRQSKRDDKPPVYFLRPDQPIAPHLDQLLGRSKLDVPLNEPIVPHLEKLLGPAKSPQEVFETLDRQYR